MSEYSSESHPRRRRPYQGKNNRNNNNRRPRRPFNSNHKANKPSFFQKLLSFLTFGVLGGSKSKSNYTSKIESRSNPRSSSAPRSENSEPRSTEVTTERLYIGNLSYDATESDLYELFSGIGSVRNAEIVSNNRTMRSKGFGFVTMTTVDEARRAVQELHGKDFMGRQLQLSGAKPLEQNREREEEPVQVLDS
jgi:RNA recognition motif-containing protein